MTNKNTAKFNIHNYITSEQIAQVKTIWKEATNKETVTLQSQHYMLYNVICGKPITTGFHSITRQSKLTCQIWTNYNTYLANQRLKGILGTGFWADAMRKKLYSELPGLDKIIDKKVIAEICKHCEKIELIPYKNA